jgi:hypothetical protein
VVHSVAAVGIDALVARARIGRTFTAGMRWFACLHIHHEHCDFTTETQRHGEFWNFNVSDEEQHRA